MLNDNMLHEKMFAIFENATIAFADFYILRWKNLLSGIMMSAFFM